MTKKEVIAQLESLKETGSYALAPADRLAALDFAIKAVKSFPDKNLGAKGGRATLAKYGKKQMKQWGKLGGRPRKKDPGGRRDKN